MTSKSMRGKIKKNNKQGKQETPQQNQDEELQ